MRYAFCVVARIVLEQPKRHSRELLRKLCIAQPRSSHHLRSGVEDCHAMRTESGDVLRPVLEINVAESRELVRSALDDRAAVIGQSKPRDGRDAEVTQGRL